MNITSVHRRINATLGIEYDRVIAGKKKPASKKAAVKKKNEPSKANKNAAKKPKQKENITKEGLESWNTKSRDKQIEYLKDHPNSAYRKAKLNNNHKNDKKAGSASNKYVKMLMHNSSGIPTREPTQEEQQTAQRTVVELEKPEAFAPNSEHREQAAATIEESAKALIKENVSEDTLKEITQAIKTGNIDPADSVGNDIQEDTDDEFDDNDKVSKKYNEDDDERIKEKPISVKKKLAILAGCVALGAILTIGVFAINPSIGVLAGNTFLEHFGSMYDGAKELLSSIENNEDEDALNTFVTELAKFVR